MNSSMANSRLNVQLNRAVETNRQPRKGNKPSSNHLEAYVARLSPARPTKPYDPVQSQQSKQETWHLCCCIVTRLWKASPTVRRSLIPHAAHSVTLCPFAEGQVCTEIAPQVQRWHPPWLDLTTEGSPTGLFRQVVSLVNVYK
jgi:hypothetical protein